MKKQTELTEKEDLLHKIINSKWNSHDSIKRFVSLFYEKEGFANMLKYIREEKARWLLSL